MAPAVERVLWATLESAPTPGRKGALFSAIVGVTLTEAGVARLERIWRKRETPRGFPVSEGQYIAIAEGLAIRGVRDAEAILDEQEARITNPDRQARQRFMRAALSADPARRDSLFRTFARVEDRRRESWVLDAMGAMNHPLRARAFVPSLEAALALTEEIQRTGDIFFPLGWLNATLGGHNSVEAAEIVRAHLAAHPGMNPRVRGKMLQASDDLFRASRAIARQQGGTAP
jgi:aminopeptidase N